MIMAIIVFFLFIAFYFILRETEKGGIETEQKLSQQFQDKLKQIETFIEGCMNQVAKKGLHYAGRQGGAIWSGKQNCRFGEPQKGSIIRANLKVLDTVEFCVRYGIQRSEDENTGDYPWQGFPLEPGTALPLDPLEEYSLKTTCNVCGLLSIPFLEDHGIAEDIEVVLRKYVDDNIQEDCMKNLESFRQQFEVRELSDFSSNITFRDNDVSIRSNYVFEVYDNATKERATLSEHKVSIPIRFRKLYNISYFLAKWDVDNINFDISRFPQNFPAENVWSWARDPNFEVKRVDYGVDGYDLIRVSDKKSTDIDGASFEFVFARENRRPALWYIRNLDFPDSTASSYIITPEKLKDYFSYSYYQQTGFSPEGIKAYDPDEDNDMDDLGFCVTTSLCSNEDGPINLLNEPCTIPFICGEHPINFVAEAYEKNPTNPPSSACGIDAGKADSQGRFVDSDLNITINFPSC